MTIPHWPSWQWTRLIVIWRSPLLFPMPATCRRTSSLRWLLEATAGLALGQLVELVVPESTRRELQEAQEFLQN